jgi:hypothetical protein
MGVSAALLSAQCPVGRVVGGAFVGSYVHKHDHDHDRAGIYAACWALAGIGVLRFGLKFARKV